MLKSTPADTSALGPAAVAARAQADTLAQSMEQLNRSARAKALQRVLAEEARERAERAALTSDVAAAQKRQLRDEQHEQLGVHIDRHNRLESRDAQRRRIVRRDTEELRDLEHKLRAAYVGRGLQAQLAEREADRLRAKLADEAGLQLVLAQRQRDADFAQAQREAARTKKLAFRSGLLEQMEHKRRQQQLRYAEFLREKRAIDEIVRVFYADSSRELLEQRQRKERFRDDLLALREQQAAWEERQRRELDEENARIAGFLVERQAKEDAQRAAGAARLKNTSDLAERLGAELVLAEVSVYNTNPPPPYFSARICYRSGVSRGCRVIFGIKHKMKAS